LSDAEGRGITVTEIAPMGQPIDVSSDTIAAFIGRALRGPLNEPVLIHNFAAFRRRFGGHWHRSSLGPAVKQFFDHGGRELYIVRVANNARGAMICLPARGGFLVLRALEPGSTENIRAAVDCDGIDNEDEQRFNLTIQRIGPDSGLVVDQEIYKRVHCAAGNRAFVGDVLLNSSLVRAQTPLPAGRPLVTMGPGVDFISTYVGHAQNGSDGTALSDYDLIGSAAGGTGLFSLNQVERFDLLYMPPPGRHIDLGPAAILAAELYCRKRGAMLIMDPPEKWTSAEEALAGIRHSGYSSPNILAYFPRMRDREDDETARRAAGGAIAGLLCKLDRTAGPWQDLDQRAFAFGRALVPAIPVSIGEAHLLVREGLNVIAGNTAGRATLCGSVTLGSGAQMERSFTSLTVRRLCLMIRNAIEGATRWAVFEADTAQVSERIQAQVHAYLCYLADAGALVNDNFFVQCDASLYSHPSTFDRGITVLLAFHPVDADEPLSLALHQTPSGCRVATTAFAPASAKCA
jgi:Bacteriophage tail sheath protein